MSIRKIIVIVATLLMTIVTAAQGNLSAVIDVQVEGVEIRRQNSELWLPLPKDAIAFIGAGDTIRTDAEGRVNVTWDDSSHMLLLSNTEYTITAFSIDEGTLSLDADLTGTAVIETSSDTQFDTFNLSLHDVTITQAADLMSVWSFPDVTDAVTVASGTAQVMNEEATIEIPAGSGFFAEDDRTESTPFDPEWHAAGLEASLYGCNGVIKTANNTTLLVRTGPGRGFQPMGTLDVSRRVPLMAMTETTGWTRIQFLTGFGWTQSLAIESDCTDLPVFADDAPEEKFVTIVNVSDDELTILRPFFKSPADNAFVYQFAANR